MENEKSLEQPESELTTDSPEASKILDRFASVQDLEQAYKSLRAEFTRKSQRMRELEQEIAEKEQNKAALPQETADTASAGAAENNAKESVQSVQVQKPANHRDNSKIIEEYLLSLASLKKAPAVIAKSTTDFVPAEQAKMKSINAVTKEAEEFFIRRQC